MPKMDSISTIDMFDGMEILRNNHGEDEFSMIVSDQEYTIKYTPKLQKVFANPQCSVCGKQTDHFEVTVFPGSEKKRAALSVFFDDGVIQASRIDKNIGKSVENLRLICNTCWKKQRPVKDR
jgi:hypothetical protein